MATGISTIKTSHLMVSSTSRASIEPVMPTLAAGFGSDAADLITNIVFGTFATLAALVTIFITWKQLHATSSIASTRTNTSMDTLDHDMSLRESEEGHSGRGSDDASQNSDSEGQESAIS